VPLAEIVPSSDCHLSGKEKCEEVTVRSSLTRVRSYMVLYAFKISVRHINCFKCKFGLKARSIFRHLKKSGLYSKERIKEQSATQQTVISYIYANISC